MISYRWSSVRHDLTKRGSLFVTISPLPFVAISPSEVRRSSWFHHYHSPSIFLDITMNLKFHDLRWYFNSNFKSSLKILLRGLLWVWWAKVVWLACIWVLKHCSWKKMIASSISLSIFVFYFMQTSSLELLPYLRIHSLPYSPSFHIERKTRQ
jgi:hypothetical protein